MSKRPPHKRRLPDEEKSSDSSCSDSFDSLTDSDNSSSSESSPKMPIKRVNKSPERYNYPKSPIRKQGNSPNPNVDTETKVNDILKKLDYNDLSSVQTMLDITLKKLDERERDLLYYQKKCLAYEKVIETLQTEIKTLKIFEKK